MSEQEANADTANRYNDTIRNLLTEALEGSESKLRVQGEVPFDKEFREVGIDSLDLMEFFLRVNDRFQLTISPDEYQHLTTINAVSNFIVRQLTSRLK